jgi:cyclopropane-fatty-acyl-phospholipid synthase
VKGPRARRALEALLSTVHRGTLTWLHEDGVVRRFGRSGEPHTTVRWSDLATERVLSEGVIGFCDGWVRAQWGIEEGTLLGLMTSLVSARLNQPLKRDANAWLKLRVLAGHLAAQITRARAHASVRSHYDLDTAFYQMWLDRDLVYTCGIALHEDDDLETMQRQKLDVVCRKLQIERGMSLLDLGCGWGALAIHAAKHYGARVTAVNVSASQMQWLGERAQREGLGDRITMRTCDFREIAGRYDRIAAVGMAEHIGKRRLGHLFGALDERLAPDGLALVHTIGSSTTGGTDPWLERAVFPGSYVPTLSELVKHAEDRGQRVLHFENLGPHYALTLRHWLTRFTARREQIRDRYGESLCRTFEMYLALLVPTFEHLSTGLFQIVLSAQEGPAQSLFVSGFEQPVRQEDTRLVRAS